MPNFLFAIDHFQAVRFVANVRLFTGPFWMTSWNQPTNRQHGTTRKQSFELHGKFSNLRRHTKTKPSNLLFSRELCLKLFSLWQKFLFSFPEFYQFIFWKTTWNLFQLWGNVVVLISSTCRNNKVRKNSESVMGRILTSSFSSSSWSSHHMYCHRRFQHVSHTSNPMKRTSCSSKSQYISADREHNIFSVFSSDNTAGTSPGPTQ